MAKPKSRTDDRDPPEPYLDHETHRAVQQTLRRIRNREPLSGRIKVRIRPSSPDDRRER